MSAAGRRPIVILALAEAVSLAGTRLSMIAIPWLVLTTTGNPVLTGIVGLAEMLPYVLAKALGGPLIDRLGAVRISSAGDFASMLVVGLVPLLHSAGLLRFELLLPIVVLLGMLRGPADTAKQSLVPAIAARASLPLERITGIMGTLERFASVIGAAAAGALVALVGAAPALAATALCCGLSALVVLLGLRGLAARRPATERLGYLAELAAGWHHFRRDPVLVGFVVMIGITNLIDQSYVTVLLPVWVNMIGDATLLGMLLAVFAASSMAGAFVATLTGERLPRLAVYAIAYLVTGAPRYLAFALGAPLPALIAVLVSAGFASGFLNPIIGAVMFERIPPALIGRVTALVNALCWVLLPFGGVVGGVLIAALGLPTAFAVMGIVYLAATMLPLALPGFRQMERRHALVAG